MKQRDHCTLGDADNRTLLIDVGGGHAELLPRQTAFAEEAALRQNGNHRFFAALRHNGQPYPATLDIEDRIRSIPLREDTLRGQVMLSSLSIGEFCQELARVEQVRL
jgi:hypothetical protein